MLAILALVAAAVTVPAADRAATTVTVHLASGAQLPLVRWALSYEFLSARAGSMPSSSSRRDSQDLRLAGRALDLAGSQLEFHHEMIERAREDGDGNIVKEKKARVTALTLTRAGKKTKLKPQAPERKFLAGEDKLLNVLPRSLDLLGETVTGTKRELCLLAYSDLAECGSTDDDRVVRIDFP